MSKSPEKINSFVLFGALGDLSLHKLIPAWYYLERDKMLGDELKILGVARQDLTKEQFQKKIQDALNSCVASEHLDTEVCTKLLDRLDYCCCDLQNSESYQNLEQSLKNWSKPIAYYLAISPSLFEQVCDGLNSINILTSSSRIVVEKPIGYNLESSKEINLKLLKHFTESQIYRIDHYLGKETVQNLVALRFANSLFSSQWSNKGVEYVEITAAESVGIEDRWGYFDGVGQMKDMVQSHILQLLCLIAMEPPNRLNDQGIRSEKMKVLESLKPLNEGGIENNFITAQYSDGEILGIKKPSYIDEQNAQNESETETFVCIKAEIQNWRWSGVPFYLRTGKRMASKTTQIVIHFKSDGHYIFDQKREKLKGNTLIISLHPTESISLEVYTKPHGVNNNKDLRSDPMSLDFIKTQKLLDIPSGYQSLLMDILQGDQSLFLCKEEVELAWQWCDNALEAHKKSNQELHFYPAGSDGPKESELLIQTNGHKWHD
jgi:glucose-6-phosphate 1-dehydrogenase